MSKSLQEQLLKAGLGDAKKLKTIKKEKHKERVQAGKHGVVVNEATILAEEARRQQQQRDLELNQQKQAELNKKAIHAQVVQLITINQISGKGELAFNFTDGTLIKRLYVNSTLQKQLTDGQVAIARLADGYALVPAAVAEKISQREPEAIVLRHTQSAQTQAEDDPYADYQIPDDLMW
jgi:hypothetical protein